MGVADGPSYAEPKPDSKPFPWTDEPCRCPECRPGMGIDFKGSPLSQILGPVVKAILIDFCPGCKKSVITTSVKQEVGWKNTCENDHEWVTFT